MGGKSDRGSFFDNLLHLPECVVPSVLSLQTFHMLIWEPHCDRVFQIERRARRSRNYRLLLLGQGRLDPCSSPAGDLSLWSMHSAQSLPRFVPFPHKPGLFEKGLTASAG